MENTLDSKIHKMHRTLFMAWIWHGFEVVLGIIKCRVTEKNPATYTHLNHTTHNLHVRRTPETFILRHTNSVSTMVDYGTIGYNTMAKICIV